MHERHSSFQLLDVIIAGAGPVGLFLACELRLAGVSVLVLEREESPNAPLKRLPFGMRGLSVPTIEAFYRRGLLDDLAPPQRGAKPASARDAQPRKQAGHFAGIPFDYADIDTAHWPFRLPSPADTNMAVEMARIETVLAARAQALGAVVLRGCGVESLEPSSDAVTVRSGERTFQARWLVGCDGGRSTVRKAGGFAFVGTDPLFTGYSVHVEIADPGTLSMGRIYTPTGMYFQSQPGVIAMVEFDGGAKHRSAPITLEHVQTVLRHVSSTDVTLTALHLATTWTDRAQQVTAYRNGRVLLAGDAAHIHAPLGGQGLNLGLGDALNLGWKLAATIRGEAPEGLLDSYFTERHPVGARVLDWSRAQVAIMQPTPQARALEAIVRDLIGTRHGATYFADRVWSASLRFDLGGTHPLVGCSAPDFALRDGRTLGGLLGEGRGLLLDFTTASPLEALASTWGQRISYVAGEAEDPLGLSAVLVRPDGIVAWACESRPDPGEAAEAAARWFTRASS